MGVDSDIAVPLEITTLNAWHALSCHHLCHCPSEFNPREKPVWKLIWTSLSSFGDAEILKSRWWGHFNPCRQTSDPDGRRPHNRRNATNTHDPLRLNSSRERCLTVTRSSSARQRRNYTILGSSGYPKSTWALRCGQLIGDRALSWSNNGLHRLADGCRLHLNHSLPISLDKALQFGTVAENLTLTNERNPNTR